MGVNKYNAEGCYDPTAYVALTRIEKESKKMPYTKARKRAQRVKFFGFK